jgi:hypothetical protein
MKKRTTKRPRITAVRVTLKSRTVISRELKLKPINILP